MIERQRSARLRDDPVLRLLAALTIGLAILYVVLFSLVGAGSVLSVLGWFIPAYDSFVALASASVAFLSFGRFRVLPEPTSFWVGLGFSAFAIFYLFGALTWPASAPNGESVIAQLPSTTGWEHNLASISMAVFLLAAILAPWPRSKDLGRHQWGWFLAVVTVGASTIASLVVIFEEHFPSIVVNGAFTMVAWGLVYGAAVLYLVCIILSLRRWRHVGDHLSSLVALYGILFLFGLALPLGERYDLWFYVRNLFFAFAVASLLFGLLSEYVDLYRRERQKTKELEALQKVTDFALAKEGTDALLRFLLERIVAIMDAHSSAILLVDNNKGLTIREAVGMPEKVVPSTQARFGELFAGRIAGLNRTYWVEDVQADPSIDSPYMEANHIRAVLGTPMRIGDTVVGVVLVYFLVPRTFGRQDERLLEVLAERAALSLESARLHLQREQLAVVEERHRLARDLHDSVTQSVYSALLYLEIAIRKLDLGEYGAVMDNLLDGREMAQETLREMRLLIFSLRPPVLEEDGLVAALQKRLDGVETRVGMQTKLFVEGDGQLPFSYEEAMYRIAQEALNNVLKHARAKRVIVRLKIQDGNAVLEIRDDGIGFDPNAIANKGGLGLRNMRERAEQIGGTLAVQSMPGNGTTIRLDVVVENTDVLRPFDRKETPLAAEGRPLQ